MRPTLILFSILCGCLSAQQTEASITITGFRSESAKSTIAHAFRRVVPALKLDDGGMMVIGVVTAAVVCYAATIVAVCVVSRRKRFSQRPRRKSALQQSIFCVLLAGSRGRCFKRLNQLVCLVSTLLCVHVYLQSVQPDFLAMAVEEWRDDLPSLQPLFILSCVVVSAAVALLFMGVEAIFANVNSGAGEVGASARVSTKMTRRTPGVNKPSDIFSPTSSCRQLLARVDVVNEDVSTSNNNNNKCKGDVISPTSTLISRLFSPDKLSKVLRIDKLTATQKTDLIDVIEVYRPTGVVMRRHKKLECVDADTALNVLRTATPAHVPNKPRHLPASELQRSVIARDRARLVKEVREFSEALTRDMLQHLSATRDDQKKHGASKAEKWAKKVVKLLNEIQAPRRQEEEEETSKTNDLIAELANAVAQEQHRSASEEDVATEEQSDAVTEAASGLPQLLKRASIIRRESSLLTVRKKAKSDLDVQTIRLTIDLQKKLKLAASIPAGVGISHSHPSAGIDNTATRPATVMVELQRFVGDVVDDDVHTFARALISIMTEVLTRQLAAKTRTLGAAVKKIISSTSLKKSTSKTCIAQAGRPLSSSNISYGIEVAKHASSCILKKKSSSALIEQEVKVRTLASSYVQAIVDGCVQKVAKAKDVPAASTNADMNTSSGEGMQLESLYVSSKIPKQEAASTAASTGTKQQNEGQHLQTERVGNVKGFAREKREEDNPAGSDDDVAGSDDDVAGSNSKQQRSWDESNTLTAPTAAPPHVVIQMEDDEDENQDDVDREYSGSLPAVVGSMMNVLLVLTTAAALSFSLVYGIGLDDKAGLLVIAGLGFGLLQQVFVHEPLKILTLSCFCSNGSS